MKKFKKILFILISISLFKTTAFATKENPNKINIINKKNEDRIKKEKKLKNVHDYIKYDFVKNKKNFDFKNIENTKEIDKNLNLLNSIEKENPNKINIINEKTEDEIKKEKEIKNVYDYIKCDFMKSTKNFDFKNVENTKEIDKNLNLLNSIEKEENKNKINIINEKKDEPKKNSKKEELETKIRKIIDNFKKFKKMSDLENVINGLENRRNSPKNIFNTFTIFQTLYGSNFKICCYDETLLALEEDIIRTLYPLIIKDDICVIAETLSKFKNQKEFNDINKNLQNDVIDALTKCSRFRCFLSLMCSKFDELFQNIPYVITTMPYEENNKILKNLNNKNNEDKKNSKNNEDINKNFYNIFKKEIEILNKKQPFINNLQRSITYFVYLYEKFIQSKFNYKITENTRKNLEYLDKVLDMEIVAKNYFNYLKDAIMAKKDFRYTEEEAKTLTTAKKFFSQIEETSEKIKSMLQTIATLEDINSNDPKKKPIIPPKDKMIESIDEFFYLFEKNKTKNFIEKNKMLKSLDFYKKMFSEMLKYNGVKINESENFLEDLEKYEKNIKDFKKEYYEPSVIAESKIINLDLEQEYKEKLDKAKKIFNDCDLLEKFFSTYIGTIYKLIGKSKIKILHYNYLNVPIERWDSLEQTLKYNKEEIEKLKYCLKTNKDACNNISELATDIKNQITIIDICKLNLKTFNDLHIENSKEIDDDDNNDSLIKKFKNIKRKHKEYCEFFKKSKEFLESFLKTIQ